VSKTHAIVILIASFCVMLLAFSQDWFLLAWVAWGLIFGTMEWYALSRKSRGDTLSEQVWLGTQSKSRWWSWFWRVSIVAFLSWLTAHFIFRI
jgi:hypothetical protein